VAAASGLSASPTGSTVIGMAVPGVPYNTLVVACGVAAVGCAAGVVGSLALLRKRPLVGDAAAHATLAGVAGAFLLTGRRDLVSLLTGALVAALVGLGALVLVRRVTRTRDDAATAIVIGGGFGLGIALVSGITARGIPGGGGLEHFLLGHAAALTADDARLLMAVSAAAIALVVFALKEFTLVAFDASFAAATGWPVVLLDQALVTLVAVMVVVGLPAAGAVLVTALIVIPPVAARQWTDRVGTLLLLAGGFGLVAALAGVAASAVVPKLPTGPLVVLVAAAICGVSLLAAPGRGLVARWLEQSAVRRRAVRGAMLDACRRAGGATGADAFERDPLVATVAGDGAAAVRAAGHAWDELVRQDLVAPLAGAEPAAGGRWRLTTAGRAEAAVRMRRRAAWMQLLETAPDEVRRTLTIDLPEPPGAGP
jgi:manganese/zinc/iron transport system permease protein